MSLKRSVGSLSPLFLFWLASGVSTLRTASAAPGDPPATTPAPVPAAPATPPVPPAPAATTPSAATSTPGAAGAVTAAPPAAAPAPVPAPTATVAPFEPAPTGTTAPQAPPTQTAVEARTLGSEPLDDEDSEPTVEHWPVLNVKTRVHALYAYTDQTPSNYFELKRARLALEFAPVKEFSAELDVDVTEAPPIKDAFVVARAHRMLEFTVGQFKKPFSRLELTSPGRLPLWDRGLVNQVLVRRQGFGGRDIGMAVGGRWKPLRYQIGVFNGTGNAGEIDNGKDIALKLDAKIIKQLTVGVSGALKYRNVDEVEYPRHDLWAGGADLRLRLGNFEAVVESIAAQNSLTSEGPWQMGTLAYTTYRIKLTRGLKLRPLLKAELLDANVKASDDHALSVTGGANLHIGNSVRLMLQAEQISAADGNATPDERRVLLELAFDSSFGIALVDAGRANAN